MVNQDEKVMSQEDALKLARNRLEREILELLFEYRPILTNRMKLDAAQKIAGIIKPIIKSTDGKIF